MQKAQKVIARISSLVGHFSHLGIMMETDIRCHGV
jgi:hypothetical protein